MAVVAAGSTEAAVLAVAASMAAVVLAAAGSTAAALAVVALSTEEADSGARADSAAEVALSAARVAVRCIATVSDAQAEDQHEDSMAPGAGVPKAAPVHHQLVVGVEDQAWEQPTRRSRMAAGIPSLAIAEARAEPARCWLATMALAGAGAVSAGVDSTAVVAFTVVAFTVVAVSMAAAVGAIPDGDSGSVGVGDLAGTGGVHSGIGHPTGIPLGGAGTARTTVTRILTRRERVGLEEMSGMGAKIVR